MKGFERKNLWFSLCGLNCGLCTMRLGGHCGGCGNGNQSCKIARCSIEHGKVEYCFKCGEFPCEKYRDIDEYDSFITHRNRMADMERARTIGIEEYSREQSEKAELLDYLLSSCNDGRRKSFFCTALNLLELEDAREAVEAVKGNGELAGVRDRALYAAKLLNEKGSEKGVELKLIRRKKPEK